MKREEVVIYFDEVEHKYTDMVGNEYISATTLIGNYEHKFSDDEKDIAKACARIGKNPHHSKYLKYKGLSEYQILKMWEDKRVKACGIGNTKHNYLEQTIKFSNNYETVLGKRDRNTKILYTIEDILKHHDYGIVDIDRMIEKKLNINYPKIYKTLVALINDGWKLYSEIAVFDPDKLVSGLIDLLAVKDKQFIIIDWKTNEAPIRFEAGYYDKDNQGNRTESYIFSDKVFRVPLQTLPESVGNKYSLQLSLYAFMVEQRGFIHMASIIFHIRHDVYTQYYNEVDDDPSLLGKSIVDVVSIKYLKSEIIDMLNDYESHRYNGKFMINFKN